MKVIVWIDYGQVKVINVSTEDKAQALINEVNEEFERQSMEMFKGQYLCDFVKHVQNEAGDWEGFERFELAEVE